MVDGPARRIASSRSGTNREVDHQDGDALAEATVLTSPRRRRVTLGEVDVQGGQAAAPG